MGLYSKCLQFFTIIFGDISLACRETEKTKKKAGKRSDVH